MFNDKKYERELMKLFKFKNTSIKSAKPISVKKSPNTETILSNYYKPDNKSNNMRAIYQLETFINPEFPIFANEYVYIMVYELIQNTLHCVLYKSSSGYGFFKTLLSNASSLMDRVFKHMNKPVYMGHYSHGNDTMLCYKIEDILSIIQDGNTNYTTGVLTEIINQKYIEEIPIVDTTSRLLQLHNEFTNISINGMHQEQPIVVYKECSKDELSENILYTNMQQNNIQVTPYKPKKEEDNIHIKYLLYIGKYSIADNDHDYKKQQRNKELHTIFDTRNKDTVIYVKRAPALTYLRHF